MSIEPQDDDFADMYRRRTLVARAQLTSFSDQVKDFLLDNAREVGHHTYHLWDSSVTYRTDTPLKLQDELMTDIALDFTARTERRLRASMDIVLIAFPGIFEEYPSRPDPLFQILERQQ